MKPVWTKKGRLLFLIPSFIGVGTFVIVPFADVVRRSFTRALGSGFVGFANYQAVLSNSAFRLAAGNTMRFLAVGLPMLLVLSLGLALLLQKAAMSVGALKTVFLLPMALPTASIAFLWLALFHQNGLMNGWITFFGGSAVNWMNTDSAFWIMVGSFLWKNIGYTALLWLSGLLAVPTSLYEAARVDGAGPLATFWYITLPNMKSCGFLITLLSLISAFKVFREAYLVAGEYPHTSIYMLQHLFNNWFRELSMDRLSAAAVMVAAATLLLLLMLLFFSREREK